MDKSKMMMVVIIVLLVLLLGTVIGVGVYLINLSDDSGGFHEPAGPAIQHVPTPADLRLVELGQMITTLALGPGGRSDSVITNVTIGLNASDSVDEDELEELYGFLSTRGIIIARDVAITTFLSRTYDQVRTLEGRLEAQEAMMYAFQDAFSSNLIVQVFFSEWNTQAGR